MDSRVVEIQAQLMRVETLSVSLILCDQHHSGSIEGLIDSFYLIKECGRLWSLLGRFWFRLHGSKRKHIFVLKASFQSGGRIDGPPLGSHT